MLNIRLLFFRVLVPSNQAGAVARKIETGKPKERGEMRWKEKDNETR